MKLCFLFGIYLFVGLSGLIAFFGQRSRLRASAVYFIGLAMIVLAHLSFFGTLVQAFGLFIIFRGYLSAIYGWVCRVPYVGKYLSKFAPLQQEVIPYRTDWTACRKLLRRFDM